MARHVTKAEAEIASASDSVDQFLAKVKNLSPVKAANGRGRLVFAMDATMSRQPSWDRALSIQGEMFVEAAKSGQLDVQLVYFRSLSECRASKWVSDAQALAKLMTTVDCRGGNTQIKRVLSHIKSEAKASHINAVVYVGDAMEENVDQLCALAGEVGLLGIPLFMFQEGNDVVAARAFKEMARLSNGAYFQLNAGSARELGRLLNAVAAYAAGGAKVLEGTSEGRMLLEQMKR